MEKQKRSKDFWRNIVSILFGAIGSQTIYVLMYNYASIFFTDFLGISAAAAGVIFFISRAWDAINDPMCGVLIEKSNPKRGKIPTWMFWGGIISAAGLIMLFTVPGLSLGGRTAWAVISYNIVGMAFTAVTVSTLLQIARGTVVPGERIGMNMSYTIGCSVTGIAVAVLVTRGLGAFGAEDPAKGYQVMAIICAAVGLASLVLAAVLFRDQEASQNTASQEDAPKTIEMIKAILKVPSFIILVLAPCIANLGFGICSSGLMYYFTYVKEDPSLMAVVLPVLYVGTLLGSVLAGPFARFGKKRMIQVSLLVMAAGGLLRMVFHDQGAFLPIGYGLMTVGSGLLVTYLNPALVDCADYAEYKTGVRCQALSLTGFTLVSKMSTGLGTAILGFAMQYGGYISGAGAEAGAQPESAIRMIEVMQFWPMIILALVGFAMMFFYKLDEKTMEGVRVAINRTGSDANEEEAI